MPRTTPPFALLPPGVKPLRPVPHSEIVEAIEAALAGGADGRLSRGAELFLVGCCGSVIAERLERAGLIVARHQDDPGGSTWTKENL